MTRPTLHISERFIRRSYYELLSIVKWRADFASYVTIDGRKQPRLVGEITLRRRSRIRAYSPNGSFIEAWAGPK